MLLRFHFAQSFEEEDQLLAGEGAAVRDPATGAAQEDDADLTPPASPSNYRPAIPLDELEGSVGDLSLNGGHSKKHDPRTESGKFMEYSVQELVNCATKLHTSYGTDIRVLAQADYLPPAISYSSIAIPLTSRNPSSTPTQNTATILRRDLFDAKFQILNEDDDGSDDEGSAYGNPVPRHYTPPKGLCHGKGDSDLIKGVYEGGLKTWEASLDLVVSPTT